MNASPEALAPIDAELDVGRSRDDVLDRVHQTPAPAMPTIPTPAVIVPANMRSRAALPWLA
jgi:hypothetical protein